MASGASGITGSWARYSTTVTASETSGSRTRFRVVVDGPGEVDLDMVSVFPEDTWLRLLREAGLEPLGLPVPNPYAGQQAAFVARRAA